MTQKKLEIIGPYTPEHEGPFCTRDGKPVRIICTDKKGERPIVFLISKASCVENTAFAYEDGTAVFNHDSDNDLMNAREVPVAREFWVNEYRNGGWGGVFGTEEKAAEWKDSLNYIRTIHVREVLPGEDL